MPIVAFANADGGIIAIGVSDKTRKIEGVDQHTENLNELLRVSFDFCNPSVPVTCSYLPCTDKDGNENCILLMEIPANSNLHTNQPDETGSLPGQVKPNNIRHTHFSRNPKIAAFLKAYHYVKEFGEGFDRICREQEANGASVPSFRTDEFILKITVPKVTDKRTETEQKPNRNNVKLTEKPN